MEHTQYGAEDESSAFSHLNAGLFKSIKKQYNHIFGNNSNGI